MCANYKPISKDRIHLLDLFEPYRIIFQVRNISRYLIHCNRIHSESSLRQKDNLKRVLKNKSPANNRYSVWALVP